MNKRLERVNTAKKGLEAIHDHVQDAVFKDDEMIIVLDTGFVFYIQGFVSITAYEANEKARKKDEQGA